MKIHIICGIKDAGKHSMSEQYDMGLKLCYSEDKKHGNFSLHRSKIQIPCLNSKARLKNGKFATLEKLDVFNFSQLVG